MLPCNTKGFLPARTGYALLLATLLGWSCRSGPPENSLNEMQAQQQIWEATVVNYETDLASSAENHRRFMAPIQDTLPSAARQKYLSDSLFQVEVHRVDGKYQDWAAKQVVATRDLRRFVQENKQWLAKVVREEISPEKASRSWNSRFADFGQLRKQCEEVQLKYTELATRYPKAGI